MQMYFWVKSLLRWTEPKPFLRHVATRSRHTFPREWYRTFVIKPIQTVLLLFMPVYVILLILSGRLTMTLVLSGVGLAMGISLLFVLIRIGSQFEPKTIIFQADKLTVTGPMVIPYKNIAAYGIMYDHHNDVTYRSLFIAEREKAPLFIGIPDDITDVQIDTLFEMQAIEKLPWYDELSSDGELG